MLSQDTHTSSDEGFNLIEMEQSQYDDNSQPILLRNPFYHKQSSSEFIESRFSTFDDNMDNDSDHSVMSYVVESLPESSVQKKVEVDTSHNEEGNEIVLKNFPCRITINYSPITRNGTDYKKKKNRVERAVQTDKNHEILRDCGNIKQERKSQNNELIKEEEDERIGNGQNENPTCYKNAKEKNHDHGEGLEEIDYKRDKKFVTSDIHLRDDDVELEEGENRNNLVQPNVFLVEVTRVEMDVEMSQADRIDHNIKVENSTNHDDENYSDSFVFNDEVQNEIKTDSSSVNASVGVSSLSMHLDISHTNAINGNLKNEIHQNVKDDNSNDKEQLQNVQIENVRGENIFQNLECYNILENMNGSRLANSDINNRFGEMEVLPKDEPCYPSNFYAGESINEDLIINIPRVDLPQVKVEFEESQVESSNDENDKNLCDEEHLMDKGQMPVDEPRIYVKGLTQLFPEGHRLLNSTAEKNSQVSSAIHSEKRIGTQSQSFGNLSDDECLMPHAGKIYTRTNRESSELPLESQDLVRRRGLRTRVLPESSKKTVGERVNNTVDISDTDLVETVRIPEQVSCPHSSEAETVILPGKQRKSTQTTPQFQVRNITKKRDSLSSETSTVTGISQQTEEEELIIFSQANEFYRGKPFSPEEDKVIIDYFLECCKKFEVMPGGIWKLIASLPELRGRTAKSVCNRFTRYLQGRCRHYITDPEMLRWFLSTTREGERVPQELLDGSHNDFEYDEL